MYNLVARHSKTSIILVVFFILCGVLGQAKEASANITTAKTPDTTVTSSPSSTTTTVSTPLSTSSTNTTPSLPSGCNLSKSSDLEKTVLEKINDMKGEKYQVADDEHIYYFSVCSMAQNAIDKDVGFVQVNKKNGKQFVLGRLNDVDLESAKNVIRLVYKNGDRYNNACDKAERTAVIYLVCNPDSKESKFRLIEENNDRDKPFCDYIFELATPKLCGYTPIPDNSSTTAFPTTLSTSSAKSSKSPDSPHSSKLGPFPIILIVVGSLFVVYLTIGTAYMRVVKKARGFEQIPNWALWSAVGNRSADCCNYVCRCGKRASEVHSYENINDHMSDDENLLNM